MVSSSASKRLEPPIGYNIREMALPLTPEDRAMLKQHVERWRVAGPELEAIRKRELQTTDVQKAVQQLFGDSAMVQRWPRLTTSGLVEQQAWFAKLRK